jgi:serine/threonine protein kinase
MSKQFLVIAGPDEGRTFSLDAADSFFVGRSQTAEVCLTDPSISRMHCRVRVNGREATLVDVESRHGTYINGKRITQKVLRPGDIISIGQTQLRFVSDTEPSTLDPAPAAPVESAASAVDQLTGLVGKTISHYEVGPVLAKGRSGLVFQARDTEDQRVVAMKVLWPEFAKDEEQKQRFLRAMKTMMPLRHPHIVSIFNAGKTGPYRWMVMEYVRGRSLKQVIHRIGVGAFQPNKGWTASEGLSRGWWLLALRSAVHLCKALDFAYEQGIIHRNITPQNILIRSGDNLTKLGDLMLAKALEGPLSEPITLRSELLGDLEYMSPERTHSQSKVDYRSDLYSLGASIYAVLTGRPPLVGKTRKETLTKIREEEPAPPKSFQTSIPAVFEKAVLKMLAKRPEDRFQTPAEVLEVLSPLAKEHGLKV